MRRFYICLFLAVAALSLAACADFEIADRGDNFNDALNDFGNRQIVLNIERASKSIPMEFAAASSVNASSVLGSAQLGVSVPFGPGNIAKNGLTPQITGQEGIAVTWTPLETSAFYQTFLNPVTAQDLIYYLQNNWISGLVFSAFVQRVTISQKDFWYLRMYALYLAQRESTDPYYCTGDYYSTHATGLEAEGATDTDIKNGSKPASATCFYIPNETDRLRAVAKGNAARCDFTDMIKPPDPNALPLMFRNAPSEPCEFFRFQYLTQVLDLLYYEFRVATIDPGPGKSGAGNAASGSGSGSGSNTAQSGGPANGASPTSPGAVNQTAPTNTYVLEVKLKPSDLSKWMNGNRSAGQTYEAYTCKRPRDMIQDIDRLKDYAQSIHAKGANSSATPTFPSADWFTNQIGQLEAEPDAQPDYMVFNMNPYADQRTGTAIGPVTNLTDLQTGFLKVRGEFQGKDCDSDETPTIQLRSLQAMLNYFGLVLNAGDDKQGKFVAADSVNAAKTAPNWAYPQSHCQEEGDGYRPMYIRAWVDNLKTAKGSDGRGYDPNWAYQKRPLLAPLFTACKGSPPESAAIKVALGGDTYYVPYTQDADNNASVETVTMLRQILALQTVGSQLVTVPTVRVLGQ